MFSPVVVVSGLATFVLFIVESVVDTEVLASKTIQKKNTVTIYFLNPACLNSIADNYVE